MNRRMLGKATTYACGCCQMRSGAGKGKNGARRAVKRRERQEWRKSL